MSVLCCHTPDFLINLTYRSHPQLAGSPLALLGADERIWAVSAQAHQTGVVTQMRPRQAQIRCPDIILHPLEPRVCQDEQAAFLGTLLRWGLPVEEQGWGQAYIDMHLMATTAAVVQPLAIELGRQLRQILGPALQPALGWDSGKFTARAAAACTVPGRMRLVDKVDEKPFLRPLPITLLPLPPPALQQLHWLGIRTLGQYAGLPATAVWQRFGAAGRLAQQWAQGRDDRPVRAGLQAAPDSLVVDLDPPTPFIQPVLAALLDALHPHLQRMDAHLEGCRRLRLECSFVQGERAGMDVTFVEPVNQGPRLEAALTHHLQTLNWPGEMSQAEIALLETGEMAAHQLTLFPEMERRPAPLAELTQRLADRYGALFFQGRMVDTHHPLPERRAIFVLPA